MNSDQTPGVETPDGQQPVVTPVEEADRGAWLTDVRERAKTIREDEEYDGTLTPKLYFALQDLLNTPIPDAYIKFTPPTEGKPYPSTGLASSQPQIDLLNAVLGPHWRAMTHFEDGGGTCHAILLIGNNLAAARFQADGNLEYGEAEVIVTHDGWGSHSRGKPGDLRKGATTNALKRVIAACGPGANVYRLDIDPELLGPQEGQGTGPNGNGQQNGAGRYNGGGGGLASEGQRKMIRIRAQKAGIPDGDLANIMVGTAGQAPTAFASAEAATAFKEEVLARLPKANVDAVLTGIESYVPAIGAMPPQAQPAPAPVPQPVPVAAPASLPPAPAPSDITTPQTLAALAPSPVEMPQPAAVPPVGVRDDNGYTSPDLGALGDIVAGQQ